MDKQELGPHLKVEICEYCKLFRFGCNLVHNLQGCTLFNFLKMYAFLILLLKQINSNYLQDFKSSFLCVEILKSTTRLGRSLFGIMKFNSCLTR